MTLRSLDRHRPSNGLAPQSQSFGRSQHDPKSRRSSRWPAATASRSQLGHISLLVDRSKAVNALLRLACQQNWTIRTVRSCQPDRGKLPFVHGSELSPLRAPDPVIESRGSIAQKQTSVDRQIDSICPC